MLPVLIQNDSPPYKLFKKFCDTLRCPLCNGQLDGNIHEKKASLYCVNDNSEYKCDWLPGQSEPEFEQITFTYSQYQYVILYSNLKTIIDRYNMDAHPIQRYKTKKEIFKKSGRLLFFRKKIEESVFLEQLKTYIIFS